jgi:Zn-dependent protease
VTLLLSGFTAFDLLLYRHHSAETSTLLYDLTFGLLAMSGMPTVVALGSFAAAVYLHRVLPRYTAHLAIAGAAILPLLLATFIAHDGSLSLEGFSITVMPAFLFAWILGTALAMPRQAQPS